MQNEVSEDTDNRTNFSFEIPRAQQLLLLHKAEKEPSPVGQTIKLQVPETEVTPFPSFPKRPHLTVLIHFLSGHLSELSGICPHIWTLCRHKAAQKARAHSCTPSSRPRGSTQLSRWFPAACQRRGRTTHGCQCYQSRGGTPEQEPELITFTSPKCTLK